MNVDLPLLLAGPILRRVEPTLASVWLALRDPCDVRLQVWEGLVASGQPNPLAASPQTPTLRVGAHLHIVQVTVEIPATAGVSFQPDSLYSYDVEITTAGGILHTFDSLHMLESGEFDGFVRLPLGFVANMLPSFAPCPSELSNLNLVYGSCRKPGHPTPDALAMVDELIFGIDETTGNNRYKDARTRPHQLFLGGDQVYADDVDSVHLLLVAQASLELMDTTSTQGGVVPVEHLPVDSALLVNNVVAASGPNPRSGFVAEDPADTAADPFIPADRLHFPEGRRLHTTLVDAQFTSSDGVNHVLSLGEFAALYLSVWSPALWGEEVTLAKFAADADQPGQSQPFRWDAELPPFAGGNAAEGAIVMPEIVFPRRVAGNLYAEPRGDPEEDHSTEDEKKFKSQESLRGQFAVLQDFHRGLAKVQRVLANVPTYMILDDHDITDDFFLNPVWRRRVLGTRLGQAILGNGMIAYALFQDWGNDPLAYRTGAKAQLLDLVARLFPPGTTKGPDQPPFLEIARLLGHDQIWLTQTPDSAFLPAQPSLKWHFTIDGPKHRAVVFDNRTRRSYVTQAGPPGNVATSALVDQLPLPPLPEGREVLVVVAPLQVIGPPVLDETVAPLSFRVFDAISALSSSSDTDRSSPTGLRDMTGTNPDAIEAWAFDAQTFEHLMKRLEPYRRVVILSGDVHYSSGTQMSYWRGNQTEPARFAQFTSSGFKNVMPAFITFVDRSVGFAQQLVRANLGTERFGWDRPEDGLVIFPPGRTERDLLPVMRSRLSASPVMLPSWGWPDDNEGDGNDPALTTRLNPAKPPDWRWRVKPLIDQTRNLRRPAGIQILDLDEADVDAKLNNPATLIEGYHMIAARHQHALGRLRNARQILFCGNVGRVRFEQHVDGRLDVIHEVFTAFNDPDRPATADPKPEPFLMQRASLGPEVEDAPGRLRKKAIEVV